MVAAKRFLSVAKAARQLGVSVKALRLYEHRGLIAPGRTAAGWRAYSADDMARAAKIVALRAIGLPLAEVARLLDAGKGRLDLALAAQETRLEGQLRRQADALRQVRMLRGASSERAGDAVPAPHPPGRPAVSFSLLWPWNGASFDLSGAKRLTYIVGPLGSGKTRLAERIAEVLPNALFVGLDRKEAARSAGRCRAAANAALAALYEDGACQSESLADLVAILTDGGKGPLVIDMIEQGLDGRTQAALIRHLRGGGYGRDLYMMTRSSAILDLDAVTADESIILCPANHSPPVFVAAYPGTRGYESVSTCLAPPDVRARSEGVVAVRLAAG
jgi:DNA-binding transcriptional MerR regulator